MAEVGIAVTKSVTWRGERERFANVYHYTNNEMVDTEQGWIDLGQAVVAAERPVHGSNVAFEELRVWSAGGTPSENETIAIIDLSGTGSSIANEAMNREACFLVEWRTSRPSITGRPVTLKKFLHSCSLLGGSGAGVLAGTEPLPAATVAPLMTYANAVRSISLGAGENRLIAPSSSDRVAGEPFVFPFVEHHEFRY